MGSFIRIQWLHEQIIHYHYPNAKTLADKFEISHRQAQRDVEFIRDSLGAPIEYIHEKKGYRYQQSFVLPTYFIAEEDQSILHHLAGYYKALTELGFRHYEGYSDLLARLSGRSSEDQTNEMKPLTPYSATVRFLEKRTNFRLLEQFCVEELAMGRKRYEFENPDLFIGLLVACGARFRLESPSWLRERLHQRAERLKMDNLD